MPQHEKMPTPELISFVAARTTEDVNSTRSQRFHGQDASLDRAPNDIAIVYANCLPLYDLAFQLRQLRLANSQERRDQTASQHRERDLTLTVSHQ
jgi:hypothetical protein